MFDLDAGSPHTPSPVEVKTVIATDAASFSHFALDVAPGAALENIDAPGGLMSLLLRRLAGLWPDLARTIVVEGEPKKVRKRPAKPSRS